MRIFGKEYIYLAIHMYVTGSAVEGQLVNGLGYMYIVSTKYVCVVPMSCADHTHVTRTRNERARV